MEDCLLLVYEVKKIIDSFWNKESGKILYMMQWKGYPKKSNWIEEPLGHCNEIDILRDFHKENARA
jgi:hypothetical protein